MIYLILVSGDTSHSKILSTEKVKVDGENQLMFLPSVIGLMTTSISREERILEEIKEILTKEVVKNQSLIIKISFFEIKSLIFWNTYEEAQYGATIAKKIISQSPL